MENHVGKEMNIWYTEASRLHLWDHIYGDAEAELQS